MSSLALPSSFARVANSIAVGCCSIFLALYFLMPYRLYPLGFGVYLLPLGLGVLFSVSCLERFRTSELALFGLFLGSAVFACLAAPSSPVLVSTAPWVSSLAIYLVCRNSFCEISLVWQDRAVRLLLTLFSAAALCQVLIGDIGYIFHWTGHPIITRYATGLDAMTNHAAVLALPLVIWTLTFAIGEPTMQRIVLWMLGCASVYFTLSRAGGLALIIAVVVVGFRVYRDRVQLKRLSGYVLLGAVAVVVAWALPTRVDCYEYEGHCSAGRWDVGGFSTGRGEFGDYSAATRVATTKVALRAIGESPITGLGIGRFPEYYLAHRNELNLDLDRIDPRVRITPHNAYLELASELGLPALAAFIALIGMSMRNALRNCTPTGIAVSSSCIGLLTWMLFHDSFSDHLFWVLLGCAAGLGDCQARDVGSQLGGK